MNVARRFQELVRAAQSGGSRHDKLASITASLQDLLDLAAIVDEELARAGSLHESVKVSDSEAIKQWGHTEGRQ